MTQLLFKYDNGEEMAVLPYFVALWEKRSDESDRSLAIIGAALLDEQLAELLASFFVENDKNTKSLLSPNGPIGAFGVRVGLSYALGLIDTPTYRDLRLIQKIRNRFAHVSTDIDFTDNKIQGMCASLEIPQWVGDPEDVDPDSPRGKYFSGVRGILYHITTEATRIRREGRRVLPEAIFPLGQREGIEFE